MAVRKWRTYLHACVKAKSRHFDHRLSQYSSLNPLTAAHSYELMNIFQRLLLAFNVDFHCNMSFACWSSWSLSNSVLHTFILVVLKVKTWLCCTRERRRVLISLSQASSPLVENHGCLWRVAMWRQTHGYLPSLKASLPIGWYQIILLVDRSMYVKT